MGSILGSPPPTFINFSEFVKEGEEVPPSGWHMGLVLDWPTWPPSSFPYYVCKSCSGPGVVCDTNRGCTLDITSKP